jgi:hypothetical protein
MVISLCPKVGRIKPEDGFVNITCELSAVSRDKDCPPPPKGNLPFKAVKEIP